jgi:regulatory protein
MDLLARREHSPRELRAKLAQRGYPADAIDATLAALEREGLLSATRYLEAFIAGHARRGQGPVRIRAELEQQGIDREAIAAALAGCGLDFAALARDVRARRFGPAAPADFAERARQLKFLQYRGFTAAESSAAVGGSRADDDDP